MSAADENEIRRKFTDAVHNRLLLEYARIINITSEHRKDYKILLQEIIGWLKYDNPDDKTPFTWPTSVGVNSQTFGIRVKISFSFWNWFRTTGIRNLRLYNQEHGTSIRIIQEKGLRNKNRERLCLYVRNYIRGLYAKRGKRPVEMRLTKDRLQIGELGEGRLQIEALELPGLQEDGSNEDKGTTRKRQLQEATRITSKKAKDERK